MNRREAVRDFMVRCFSQVPSWLVFDRPDAPDEFSCLETDDDNRELVPAWEPMWGYLFIPDDSYVYGRIEDDPLAVARRGFTLVYKGDELLALGVDGAGYSFADAHFGPLYDWLGFHWHDREDDDVSA